MKTQFFKKDSFSLLKLPQFTEAITDPITEPMQRAPESFWEKQRPHPTEAELRQLKQDEEIHFTYLRNIRSMVDELEEKYGKSTSGSRGEYRHEEVLRKFYDMDRSNRDFQRGKKIVKEYGKWVKRMGNKKTGRRFELWSDSIFGGKWWETAEKASAVEDPV